MPYKEPVKTFLLILVFKFMALLILIPGVYNIYKSYTSLKADKAIIKLEEEGGKNGNVKRN